MMTPLHRIVMALLGAAVLTGSAMAAPRHRAFRNPDSVFMASDEAVAIGEQVLAFQRSTGGWPKNKGLGRPMTEEELEAARRDSVRTDDSTIDNNATTMELHYLARLNDVRPSERYRKAFRRGIDWLLSGQYDNGGWPQFWPNPQGYQTHITYNDNAMTNTLLLFQALVNGERPYAGLLDAATLERVSRSFDKAVEVILATQIVVDGEPTVWCQQHDRTTYLPAKARSYELPSYCSYESAGLMDLLMSIPDPDARVVKSVHAAARWLDAHKLTGTRLVRDYDDSGNCTDVRLVADPTAPDLWARFYGLDDELPYVCDRDGVPRRNLSEIGLERRSGYGWYDTRTGETLARYRQWALTHPE